MSRRSSREWGTPAAPGPAAVDVLIPTAGRIAELAVTLAGLAGQDEPGFRVIVSDQSEDEASAHPAVQAMARVLRAQGREIVFLRHLPRRGMAEQRHFLLSRAMAESVLFLDDDVWLEPGQLERMWDALQTLGCGFVGAGLIGPSFAEDRRPHEQPFEPWPGGRVQPENVVPESTGWDRYRLHNAANLHHLRERLEAETGERPADTLYKVAWVGGCVLYDTAKLRETGGFSFWRELPERHAGEDVLAQLRLMRRYGGAGLFPSGAYHLELPTTIPDREVDAPRFLGA